MPFYAFLILIFLRPFICSAAYPVADFYHTVLLLGSSALFFIHSKRFRTISLQEMKIPVFVFIGAIALSCLLSQDKTTSLTESYNYSIGLLLFFIGFSLSEEEKIKTLNILFYAGVLVSFLALYQYAFGFRHLETYITTHHINDEFVKNYIAKKRVFAPFFGPNILAGYLAMIAPLGLISTKKRGLILPIGLALLLTQSLGAFVSIFLAAATLFYLIPAPKTKRRTFLVWFCISLAVILWFRITDPVLFRQPYFSIQMRFQYWEQALVLIKKHPLIGVGIGLFDLSSARHAHNIFLETWAESGIVGVSCLLFFLGCLFQRVRKKITAPLCPFFLPSVFAGVLIFLFHNLFDISFFFPETVFIWWLLAGLAAS